VTTAGPEVARISIRRQQFVIGRPIELDEASPRISAVEYAVGAVAGEVVNGLRVFASRHRIDLDRVEAVATGELQHGLTYLEVVGEGGQPRIARVRLKVFVATADEPGVRRLWDALISKLPFRTRGQLLSSILRAETKVGVRPGRDCLGERAGRSIEVRVAGETTTRTVVFEGKPVEIKL
jgi:hypothetical protein